MTQYMRTTTTSTKHSHSWGAKSFWACQVCQRISRHQYVHYRMYKSSTLLPIPGQINSVNTLPSDYFKIHFKIVLPSTPRSSKSSISFGFFLSKLCIYFASPPYVLYAPPISAFWIWSSKYYLTRTTNNEVPDYVISSNLLLHPFQYYLPICT